MAQLRLGVFVCCCYVSGAIHQRIDVAEIDDMAETNPYRVSLS